MKKLRPVGDSILVLDNTESTILGGIEQPSNVRQKEMLFGVVVAVNRNSTFKERMVITYGPYAGANVILNGVEFRLMREGQVAGIIEDEDESERENVA